MNSDIYLSFPEDFIARDHYAKGTIGHRIAHLDSDTDIGQFDIALVGVLDARGAKKAYNTKDSSRKVRERIYQLYDHFPKTKIVDLGDVLQGDSPNDTYFAMQQVIKELIKKEVVPFVIGGSQDLTYANYMAYEELEQSVNVVSVDSRIDIGVIEEVIDESNYMNKIIMHQPNYLFNYSCVGFQSYYTHPDLVSLMENLYFDAYRLGKVKSKIEEIEPVLRGADILSIDMKAIKKSDAPGTHDYSPNGFSGEELCRIARYAGISDKLTSIGVYNYIPGNDADQRTAELIAQVFWYFVEGYNSRLGDYPVGSIKNCTKYIVMVDEQSIQLTFYKSDKSGRWWLEVPHPENGQFKHDRHTFMSCSYEDYQCALTGEIPERWWQSYQKML